MKNRSMQEAGAVRIDTTYLMVQIRPSARAPDYVNLKAVGSHEEVPIGVVGLAGSVFAGIQKRNMVRWLDVLGQSDRR